jgi:hypothetical protein
MESACKRREAPVQMATFKGKFSFYDAEQTFACFFVWNLSYTNIWQANFCFMPQLRLTAQNVRLFPPDICVSYPWYFCYQC